MFFYSIKIALRNIAKQKMYAVINLLSLVIGLSTFLFITLYTLDELSYDKHHTKTNRIFRIIQIYEKSGVGEQSASVPFPLAKTLKEEYPDLVEKTVRIFNLQIPQVLVERDGKRFNEKNFYFTDSAIFEIFDFNFIYGDTNTLFGNPNTVIISKSTSQKYFGLRNPIGKTIVYEEGFQYKVTGVFEDFPHQSHFHPDFLTPMATLQGIMGQIPNDWIWNPCWTYILLKKSSAKKILEHDFPNFVKKYYSKERRQFISLKLQAIQDIHLNSKLDYELERNSNKSYVYILFSMGVFILIIMLINYNNLSIAGLISRAKEVGLKKVFGSHRITIFLQFSLESICAMVVSTFLALVLVELLLHHFNDFTAKTIELKQYFNYKYLSYLLLLCFGLGSISGIYPSFILSAHKPTDVLRKTFTNTIKAEFSRKLLIVAQYVISIILIITTFVNLSQFIYLRTADLGFNKEDIIVIPVSNNPILNDYEYFKNNLMTNNEIEGITIMSDLLGVSHNSNLFTPKDFEGFESQLFPKITVGYDFLSTFQMQVLSGRDFFKTIPEDNQNSVLINESLAKYLGIKDINTVCGKQLHSIGGNEKIIGVIKDFNTSSLHQRITPMVIQMPRDISLKHWYANYMAIRFKSGTFEKSINLISKYWEMYAPNRPFDYSLLKQELQNQYKSESVLANLSILLTLIAVFIASLGILGLTSHITEQKTKEIGIRKILGANDRVIIKMISIEFLKLIIISNLIAAPLAWLLLKFWLSNFAYAINLALWMFVAAGAIVIMFALLMASIQVTRVIHSNPAEALRYE